MLHLCTVKHGKVVSQTDATKQVPREIFGGWFSKKANLLPEKNVAKKIRKDYALFSRATEKVPK